eukprot:1210577-Amphidinium_carterae.1
MHSLQQGISLEEYSISTKSQAKLYACFVVLTLSFMRFGPTLCTSPRQSCWWLPHDPAESLQPWHGGHPMLLSTIHLSTNVFICIRTLGCSCQTVLPQFVKWSNFSPIQTVCLQDRSLPGMRIG